MVPNTQPETITSTLAPLPEKILVSKKSRVMRTVKNNVTLEAPGVLPSSALTVGNAQVSTNLTSSNTTGPYAEVSQGLEGL